jgi:hypothetical protein
MTFDYPNEVPTMHLNLTPDDITGELPREGKVWVAD